MEGRTSDTPSTGSSSSEDAVTIGGPADASPPPAAPLPERIGRYRIVGRLGGGGMGVVLEAEQDEPRRRVALKVIRGGVLVDEDSLRLFRREVDTLARLDHPNIAAIYEAGHTESGEHFFAMELVRGLTLGKYLEQRPGPLDPAEIRFRLRLFLVLCGAVSYAHQRGVIHRDLKPSNIIVADSAPAAAASPALKVLDFGLARIMESDVEAVTVMTEVGVVKGTLRYMSPEQVRGEGDRVDVRSDVYTLGVILQEILTGRRPYDVPSASLVQAARVITEQPPMPLRQAWKGTRPPDPDLQTIVGKALEKDRERRYASTAALADDIERYLDSRPILARAPSAMYQARKFTSRHRALVGGAAATLLALVAGVIASTTFGLREAAQRRVAEQAQHDTQAMVDFQAGMLADVDAALMGHRLQVDLTQRVDAAQREAHLGPERAAAEREAFQAGLARINPTDAALHVIDENILSRAIATSAKQFADRPLLHAQLLASIGATYSKLGLLDRAEPPLQQAIALYGRAPDSEQGLLTSRALAELEASQGRTGEAESLFVRTLAAERRVLGPDHDDVLATMDDLAILYTDTERYPAAESLFAIELPADRRRKGAEDPATLACLKNYAWALISQDKYAQAESLAVLAVTLDRKVMGMDHKLTLDAVNNLGVLYARTDRPERAEPLYVEDLAMSRRLFGDEHPDVLVSMTNLGRLDNRLHKYAQAESILAKAAATTRKVMPPGFIGLGITLLAHSEALVGLGRDREAEPDALEAYRILRALRSDGDPGVQRAVKVLVDVYAALGRPDALAQWKSKLAPSRVP
jgi:tetratricopeptide (TPR) repeat protein